METVKQFAGTGQLNSYMWEQSCKIDNNRFSICHYFTVAIAANFYIAHWGHSSAETPNLALGPILRWHICVDCVKSISSTWDVNLAWWWYAQSGIQPTFHKVTCLTQDFIKWSEITHVHKLQKVVIHTQQPLESHYTDPLWYKHTKHQVELQEARQVARSHWNALWHSKTGPRPIPKWEGKRHTVQCNGFNLPLDAQCVYIFSQWNTPSMLWILFSSKL